MTRHARINTLIKLLQQGPQTVDSLSRYFEQNVSARQIRSDIAIIKALGYGDKPDFEKTGRANQKTWQIKVNDYERNTLRLAQGVLPQVFNLKRKLALEELTSWSESGFDALIESTHFYEAEAYNLLDENLEIIIHAIDTRKKVQIVAMNGDATSVLRLVKFPITVLPVKIIYHRGCFYVATIADTPHQVLVFQIDQLTLVKTSFSFDLIEWIQVVEKDLETRFGVTQNIDEAVYDIELRFSSITGEFVGKQFWHHSQKELQDGNDWIITFQCGINRELVGWIYLWMSNVRVIGPPALKALYDEQLSRMLALQRQPLHEPLTYTNLFAPTPG